VLGHLLGLLLAHRAAQHVGAAQRVAADDLRDLAAEKNSTLIFPVPVELLRMFDAMAPKPDGDAP
jgi:hypothetical protein